MRSVRVSSTVIATRPARSARPWNVVTYGVGSAMPALLSTFDTVSV